MSNKAGKISQIMGAVVDVSFEDNHLPEIISNNGILINQINSKKISKNLKQILSNTSMLKELQKKSWKNFNFNSKKISTILDDHRKELFFKN